MALHNIHAFGQVFDLTVTRAKTSGPSITRSNKPGWLSIHIKGNGQEKTYTLREGSTLNLKP